jgi:nucleoside-diphosphate-sugar epimerase
VSIERPVLVTGGTGFIGRHLVSALHRQGIRVRVLARHPDAAIRLTELGAELVVGDLLDEAAIGRAVSGVRAVFHLAGRLFSPGIPAREYQRLHVESTIALMEACAGLERLDFFLLCSTTGVHGPTRGTLAREDDPGRPQNAYEWTKARAEQVAIEIARRRGLPLAIARPGLVYGPGDRHLLGLFRAIRRGYYRVIGPGENRFHPIYIDDLVQGLLLSAAAAGNACRTYHLVGSHPVTLRDFSDAIGAAVGRTVPKRHLPVPLAFAAGATLEVLPVPRRLLPLTRSRVRFMTQDRAYDGSRAFRELGFTPRVDLAAGLSRTVAWYQENGLL